LAVPTLADSIVIVRDIKLTGEFEACPTDGCARAAE
jgi:hypothetical protein